MNFNINIIRFFKTARDSPADEKFLRTLRGKLVDYIRLNPPLTEKSEKTKLSILDLLQLRAFPLAIAGGLIIFGSGTLVYSQNSLPGNALYPVKLLSEKVRSAAVFNPSKAVDLHINLAQKRMLEMERVLGDASSENRAKNIEGALTNFTQNIDKVYHRAQEFKENGELEEALETNNDLKTVLELSQNKLEANKERFIEGEQKIIEKTINSVSDWRQDVNEDIAALNADEERRATESGFEQSAKGKMEAAKNKIDEVKDFINKRGGKLQTEGMKDAENKLDEAKRLLDSAKSLYDEQKYEEAFGKSREAFETASQAKTSVKIFPEITKIVEKDDGGDRAMRTSSSSSTSSLAGARDSVNDDSDKNENETKKEDLGGRDERISDGSNGGKNNEKDNRKKRKHNNGSVNDDEDSKDYNNGHSGKD